MYTLKWLMETTDVLKCLTAFSVLFLAGCQVINLSSVPPTGADAVATNVAPTSGPPVELTPSLEKELSSFTPGPEILADIVRRPAGAGTILEIAEPRSGGVYCFENEWDVMTQGNLIKVFAGALCGNGVRELEKPWFGVLVIESPNSMQSESVYTTPVQGGPVRVVEANGMRLTIVNANGNAFWFDVETRRFVMPGPPSPFMRSAGNGIIVETGNVPSPLPGYVFENQWYTEQGSERITVYAGSGGQRGAVVVETTPAGQPGTGAGQEIYIPPVYSWPLRIVDAEGEHLTLATRDGGRFIFDVASRQFVYWPNWPEILPTEVPTTPPPLVSPTSPVLPTATVPSTSYPVGPTPTLLPTAYP